MSLTKCSECAKEISDKAEICPHCGNTSTPKGKLRKGIIGTLGTIKLVLFSLIELTMMGLFFAFGHSTWGWIFVAILVLTWWLWIKSLKKM
ncbi:hypothetical protein C0580_01170 [Candidatus Parcubacteria bacterium]|nr:MAG: hypothetical protein C0580_01170 [Candidatus Parcubacteria bacterium]